MVSPPEIEIRPWVEADRPVVLSLLATSLGWEDDALHDDFFEWKHRAGSFGPSPAWVATSEDRVVGFRVFQRWRFRRGDKVVPTVRAVDTATDPAFARRGIFSRLTHHALDEMRAEGVAFVFNNPNEKSRPGYLKMGWEVLGQLPIVARPPWRPTALWRMARARGPAGKWGLETDAGVPAGEVIADRDRVAALLASQPPTSGLRTDRTPEYLAWRYGFGPLGYRALLAGDSPAEGFAVFRLRRRGDAVEALVCDVVVPEDDHTAAAALARRVVAATPADYALAVRDPHWPRRHFVPLPRQGPVLTWRALNEDHPDDLSTWNLTLGDVELF
jgi:GNAT superfamily N-acetyltransferase